MNGGAFLRTQIVTFPPNLGVESNLLWVRKPGKSHIIGDGHQPNSRGLYTHYKHSLLKVGGLPSPIQGV